jgi:hypothetical protein
MSWTRSKRITAAHERVKHAEAQLYALGAGDSRLDDALAEWRAALDERKAAEAGPKTRGRR